MKPSMQDLLGQYDPNLPLEEASTIPASWYTDDRIMALERQTTFARTWQLVGRIDQVRDAGQYITCELAGEPILVVRGNDGVLRGFFNVCRHHAAAVMTEAQGCAQNLRCPYHGWTYTLEGALKGTPSFHSECHFDRSAHALAPVTTAVWEQWVFVRLDAQGPGVEEFLGAALVEEMRTLKLSELSWFERRHYFFDCNWKVFVDNYLDGGYHVPHLHKGLDSVLDFKNYTIENGMHHCLQSSPIVRNVDVEQGVHAQFSAVRGGDRAHYYWVHPNFMINWYEGVMDTNLVLPLGIDRTEVIFDFYFADVSDEARARNQASIDVGQIIQDEDMAICKSVQRGLNSRAYSTGRLSVRREAGEHLFHRLLHADLTSQR